METEEEVNCSSSPQQFTLRSPSPAGSLGYSPLQFSAQKEYKNLEGEHLLRIQQSLADVQYLIIDEMSMAGRKMFGQVDSRLRQVFPHHDDQVLGGCSCLLFGDFGQHPPVMDLPLYTTAPRSALSDLGSSAYQMFDNAVVHMPSRPYEPSRPYATAMVELLLI